MSDNHEGPDKPFNDVIDHFQKVEGGVPTNPGGRLPFPIRLIGYVLVGGVVLLVIFGLIGNFFFN